MRELSKTCAICLTEYEASDEVSWSKNPQCPHIFHTECITSWFVSLGKMQCIQTSSLEDECPRKVLNYQLDCPCCRQEFISTPE